MKITLAKDMAALRTAARDRITRAAAAERAKHVTGGKANTYRDKRLEADAWIKRRSALGVLKPLEVVTPTVLKDFPYLAAEIGITGATADDVAALWQAKSIAWNTVTGPAIEKREMAAKVKIDAATTPAELDAITL